jgi:hypothetical protein
MKIKHPVRQEVKEFLHQSAVIIIESPIVAGHP